MITKEIFLMHCIERNLHLKNFQVGKGRINILT